MPLFSTEQWSTEKSYTAPFNETCHTLPKQKLY